VGDAAAAPRAAQYARARAPNRRPFAAGV